MEANVKLEQLMNFQKVTLIRDEQSSDDEFEDIIELGNDEGFDQFDDDDDDYYYDGDVDSVTGRLLNTWKGVKLPNKEEVQWKAQQDTSHC